jgi:hypothetical protein
VLILAMSACGSDPGGSLDQGGTPDVPADADAIGDPGGIDDGVLEQDAPADEGTSDSGPEPYEGGATALVASGVEDLIGGPAARGTIGDLVLRNRHSRFVVRTGDRGLFSPCGGDLLDADMVRPEGEPGRDRLVEIFPMVGMARVLCPDSIQIIDDGTYSGTAVVRLTGTDRGFPLVDSIIPTMPMELDLTMDYVLRPDARHLEIVMRITNPWSAPITLPAGQIVQFGDRLDFFADGCGPDDRCIMGRGDVDWIGAGSRDVSYGFTTTADARPEVMLSESALLMVKVADVTVPGGSEATLTHFVLVGDGTIEDVARQARELRGVKDFGTLEATVVAGDPGTLPSDALLSVREGGGGPWMTSSRAGSSGNTAFALPPGTYDVQVDLPGTMPQTRSGLEVSLGETTPLTVTLEPVGRVLVTVEDGDEKPLDALFLLQAGHDAPWTQGAIGQPLLVRNGTLVAPVLPGAYTAVVAKGFAYDAWTGNLTVEAGETATIQASLNRVIETPGELFMDTHDHCELSIDSQVTVEDRIYNALAVGLEVYSTVDHDRFGTLQPVVEALGLQERILAVPGNEISPVWGHTASIGCDMTREKDTYFEVPFLIYGEDGSVERNVTASEIWNAARQTHGCSLLLIAHPFGSKGMLDTYKVTDTSDPDMHLPAMDLRLVDGFEILNASQSWEVLHSRHLPAWFNMLRRGYRLSVLGGADTHGLAASLGHPRNLVPAGTSNPGQADPEDLYTSIREGRSQVVAGPILRLTVDDKGPGEVATAQAGMASVRLEILAAPWVPVDTARVYVNGDLVIDAVVEPGANVVRAVIEEDIPLQEDAFILAVAGSPSQRLGVAVENRLSVTITNPVFVDADGGGYLAVEDPARLLAPQDP